MFSGCNEVESNETTDVEYEKTIENDDGTRKDLMEEFENADVPDGSKVNAAIDADVHDDIESRDVGTNADEMEREESDKTVNKEVPDIRAVESCGTKVDEDKQEDATTDAEGETESLITDKVVGTDVPVVSTDVPDKVVGTDVPVVGTKVVNETLVESAKVVGTDVPVIGATFHKLFEVEIESKGKQIDVQEKEQVEETLNAERKQPFDSFDYDGPNWSVGLTQLEEIGSQNKTGMH
ncbi:hypothetical protein HanHA89_Chr17g0717701 [Helianthus annuus]|nr:hypothetical protein HanHA89_Chr17g0717701 [Helianthus annuus]